MLLRRQLGTHPRVLHSFPMIASVRFFAYFWFSPRFGGWRGKRV
jgi:hypothetical protein